MDSEALQTFLTVHRRGGVSAAAIALSRTQSAISRRLLMLEAQVGAPLFDRIGRSLVLSEVGMSLLPFAERVIATLQDARAAVDAAKSGEQGQLRIATVGTLASARLSDALQRVKQRLPHLDVRLQTATSAEVSALVRAGEASVGLRYFEDRSPELDSKVIHQEPLVVACATRHALAGKRVKSLTALGAQRWFAFPATPRRRESFAATIAAQFLTRGIDDFDCVTIDSLTAQTRLVEAGLGLALLQAEALEEGLRAGRLSQIHVQDMNVSVPVVRVLRKGSYLSGAAQALLEEIERPTRRQHTTGARQEHPPRHRAR